jgi:hypothetical protein
MVCCITQFFFYGLCQRLPLTWWLWSLNFSRLMTNFPSTKLTLKLCLSPPYFQTAVMDVCLLVNISKLVSVKCKFFMKSNEINGINIKGNITFLAIINWTIKTCNSYNNSQTQFISNTCINSYSYVLSMQHIYLTIVVFIFNLNNIRFLQ